MLARTPKLLTSSLLGVVVALGALGCQRNEPNTARQQANPAAPDMLARQQHQTNPMGPTPGPNMGAPNAQPSPGSQDQQGNAGKPEQQGNAGKPEPQADMGKSEQQGNAGKPEQQADTGKPEQQGNAGKPEQQADTGKLEQQGNAGKPEQQADMGKPEQQANAGKPNQQDAAITANVKAAIEKEPALKEAKLDVNTVNGVVKLGGFVDSKQSADRAVQIARSNKDVKSVENNLVVKPAKG
jgi:hyperosmotically inducible protein